MVLIIFSEIATEGRSGGGEVADEGDRAVTGSLHPCHRGRQGGSQQPDPVDVDLDIDLTGADLDIGLEMDSVDVP